MQAGPPCVCANLISLLEYWVWRAVSHSVSDNSIGRIELDPAGTRDVNLAPGMGGSPPSQAGPSRIRYVDIARSKAIDRHDLRDRRTIQIRGLFLMIRKWMVLRADLIRVAVARIPSQAIPLLGTYWETREDELGMNVDVNAKAASALL